MHLSSEIKPLRGASPVFLSKQHGSSAPSSPQSRSAPTLFQEGGGGKGGSHIQRNQRSRPKTASGAMYDQHSSDSRSQLPASVISDTASVTRTREMKRLFKKPTGAYMSTKV